MKLTRKILNQIIKEEIQAVLKEEKDTLDRSDATSVRAAARMIAKAEGLESDKRDKIGLALSGGRKKVLIVGGPRDGDAIDLLKYITYKD
tara:strand:+ start:334 stop:603 length:270 start_codon:yes stop_codon:yes gene_type:complete